jgi:hypothetical protein
VPVSVSVEEMVLFAVPLLFNVIVLVLVPLLSLARLFFGIAPSRPSRWIAGRERLFASFLDFKFGRVIFDRFPAWFTPFVRYFRAHSRNLEPRDHLASTFTEVQELQEFRSCRIGSSSIMRKPEG